MAAGLLGGGLFGSEALARPVDRPYSVGAVHLSLEKPAGFLKSADGGEAYAEVILEPGQPFDSKSIGSPPLYEDIVVQAGAGMNGRFYEWIAATWLGKIGPKDGAITTTNYDYKPKAERRFTEAYITETKFPACDAASKDAAYMTLTITPKTTEVVDPSSDLGAPGGKGKQWIPANFRLEIDDLECKTVNKISSFTVKLSDPEGSPKIEFSNLLITFAESSSESWNKWYQKFTLNGNSDGEREGKLVFLTPNLQSTLMSVDLHGLGLLRLGPEKVVAGSEAIARMVAELYVERMEFNPPKQ